jgi:small-conductance mechanosensitive channel
MVLETLQSFRTISELQQSLDREINRLKTKTDEMSKLTGEKLRSTESNNTAELQELRQKLEGGTADPKKKKTPKKKDQKSNWYSLDSVLIYDGIGIKGELELYFKGTEEIKSELDRLTKVKQQIDELVNKGLKKDLGCVLLLKKELPVEIAFTNTAPQRKRFAFKAIFNVPKEELNEIENSQ